MRNSNIIFSAIKQVLPQQKQNKFCRCRLIFLSSSILLVFFHCFFPGNICISKAIFLLNTELRFGNVTVAKDIVSQSLKTKGY